MRSGPLKNIIIIARRVEIVDEFGRPTKPWTPIARLRAQIISSDATTFLAEAGEQIETAFVFRTRFCTGIELGDRVTFVGREFELVEIKEAVARRVLELRCRATGRDGHPVDAAPAGLVVGSGKTGACRKRWSKPQ